MDIFEAVKAKALRCVLRPDVEYMIRHIFRWYSRTFSTPLQEVYDLPLEEVLLHYYEVVFEDLDDHERLEAIGPILETKEQREAERRAEDAKQVDDKEFAQFAQQMNQNLPPPRVIAGEDDEIILAGRIEAPPPMPIPLPTPPPQFSLSFDDEGDNLIFDDVERFNSMAQPEDDE